MAIGRAFERAGLGLLEEAASGKDERSEEPKDEDAHVARLRGPPL